MATISDIMGFSASVKRFMQRRRYKRLDKFNGERRRLRAIKLGGRKGRLLWKLKFVPKLKLSYTKLAQKVSAKSWLRKLRDSYVNMMSNPDQSRFKQTPKKTSVEDFNNKLITEIYKSLGVQVMILPDSATTAHRQLM
ncbi:hypothetical protein SUGI_0114050 [Cryptomeria japonica]|nr:hypothetical protein SUGI_0114050 [Cryptomeria japonica]